MRRLRDWRSDPEGAPGTDTGDYLVLHSYSYDFAGRLASDTDAMGRRLEYTYYRDDLLHKITMEGVRNPIGTRRDYVVEERTYDAAPTSTCTHKIEANGTRTTQFTYDGAGKLLTSVEDPAGLNRTTTMAYDGNGNVRRTIRAGKASNVPWPVAAVSETVDYTYDNDGNLRTERVLAGSEIRTTNYTYDQRGLRLSVTDPRGPRWASPAPTRRPSPPPTATTNSAARSARPAGPSQRRATVTRRPRSGPRSRSATTPSASGSPVGIHEDSSPGPSTTSSASPGARRRPVLPAARCERADHAGDPQPLRRAG